MSKELANLVFPNIDKTPEYYEELFFVVMVNEDYGHSHYFANTVDTDCKVVSKTFYRTKEQIK